MQEFVNCLGLLSCILNQCKKGDRIECEEKCDKIQKMNYSKKRGKIPHIAIGDKVLKKDFRRKKRAGGALDPKWLGPYEVTKDIGKDLFLVKKCDNGKVDRVHGDH